MERARSHGFTLGLTSSSGHQGQGKPMIGLPVLTQNEDPWVSGMKDHAWSSAGKHHQLGSQV